MSFDKPDTKAALAVSKVFVASGLSLAKLTAAGVATCVMIAPDAAFSSTLTLLNSEARVQVAASNRPPPRDERAIDPISAHVNQPSLGGWSSADVLSGQMRFATSANDTTGFGTFGTTNTTSISYLFRYNGINPLMLPGGAFSYSASADFARAFAFPEVNSQPVAAKTDFVAGLVFNAGLSGNASARVEVTETSDGNLDVKPDSDVSGIALSVLRANQTGLDALFESPAIFLNDGDTWGFTATMVGNGVRVGPRGFQLGVTASVDASNTGLLSLVLPDSVGLAGLAPGQELSWIRRDPPPVAVPLPAAAVLLLTGIGALIALCGGRTGKPVEGT